MNENILLYIYLENKFHQTPQMVLKYISEIYSRCWDELVYQNKIRIHCIVSSDESLFNFIPKMKILQSEKISKAYICHQNDIDPTLSITNLKVYPIDYFENENVFYFDAGDSSNLLSPSQAAPAVKIYSKLAIGGTFDQLHNGHRKLLTLASAMCNDTLTIGVLSDALLTKKSNAHLIQPFHIRKKYIEYFMNYLKPSLKLDIVELFDPFGPTITDPSFEGIVVSSETLVGAQTINKLRHEKGFGSLDILVIKRSDVSTLSSTYLRERSRDT